MNVNKAQSFYSQGGTLLDKLIASLRFGRATSAITPGAKILDVGCGFTGEFLHHVENIISAGYGVDMFVDREHNTDKIRLSECNLNLGLPFSDNDFDIVVSLANLEHMENPDIILKEIRRVLKPGGSLILTAPTSYAKPVLELMALFHIIDRHEISDHKRYFNKKSLYDYCGKAGYTSYHHLYFELMMNNFLIANK